MKNTKPVKISKSREALLNQAIFDAFHDIIREHLPSEEIDHPPDSWIKETREKFDMLSEMQHRAIDYIFTRVFISNNDPANK